MIIAIIFILGICIGSFINVVVYRLPIILNNNWQYEIACSKASFVQQMPQQTKTFNLLFPASHCIHCNCAIKWMDKIPLLSYLLLLAKCRYCKQHIAIRYFIVEGITGILFMLIAMLDLTYMQLVGYLILSSFMLALIAIDYDTFLLPDELTLPLLWLGLVFNFTGSICGSLQNAVAGAIIGYLSLWTIYWIFKLITKKDGMGYGDFKLLAAIGAWFGYQNLLWIITGSALLGLVYASYLAIVTRNWRVNNMPAIPYGPFLGAMALLKIFASVLI